MQCYFATFPKESEGALKFVEENITQFKSSLSDLSPEEQLISISIVAPEISQYSDITDFIELRTLFISYRNYGKGDFSVGYFQMKPSFIEGLEREIEQNRNLKIKYFDFLPEGDEKNKRATRLKRLSSLDWQLKYLSLFMDVVKLKTSQMKFSSQTERLRYLATLYNSGFNISAKKVAEMQNKKLFPHARKNFNYADIAEEFYNEFKKRNIL